jgi:hypothetical protein
VKQDFTSIAAAAIERARQRDIDLRRNGITSGSDVAREARKMLDRLASFGCWEASEPQLTSATIVRAIFTAAKIDGLSGEDTYAIMAHELAKALDNTAGRLLEFYRATPTPPIIFTPTPIDDDHPCRSPYCECTPGQCREGRRDARGEPLCKHDFVPVPSGVLDQLWKCRHCGELKT